MKRNIFFLILLILLSLSCRKREYAVPVLKPDTANLYADIPRKYGLAIDSFDIYEGKIRPNQYLGDLLLQFRIDHASAREASLKAGEVLDITRIRAGNSYTAFCSRDSMQDLRYFIYEHTPSEYFVFDFSQSVSVYRKSKAVRNVYRSGSGTISTSLWDAMKESNISPVMAIELSEIFAWSIDFFGLQAGDKFSVIYEESFVDEMSTGINRIYAACFRHMGEDFFAIPFEQDSATSYFDQHGNSLRKAFLKAPLRFSRISSRFSYSRLHPILKIRRPHFGIDYAAPVGTPVYAIGDGRVTRAGYEGDAGRMVRITHNSVYSTAYLHLRNFAPGIAAGAYVRQGQVIGYVGSSGLSTGPHLDFRFYRNGSPVDPLRVESPSVEPVKPENMPAFNQKKQILQDLLDIL